MRFDTAPSSPSGSSIRARASARGRSYSCARRTREGTAYNLVGFQTNLTFAEQRRVLRLIPGLEHAEFLRYGVMHRNTFIDAPRLLDQTLALRTDSARQVRRSDHRHGGVPRGRRNRSAGGPQHSSRTVAGNQPSSCRLQPLSAPSSRTRLTRTRVGYQPMHVNFGLVPPLAERVRGKRERYAAVRSQSRTSTLPRGSLEHPHASGEESRG